MPEEYVTRMSTIQNYEQDASAMNRFDIWDVAIKMFKSSPLIGVGFRATYSQEIVDRFDPAVEWRAIHNIFICVLAEHGLIGFLLWLALP